MSIKKIHLRKLLAMFHADKATQIAMLRTDIRNEIRKQRGALTDGGDFHAPFWRDAKDHVNGGFDLRNATADRVLRNEHRRRLYPMLTDGFLEWWDNKRRWTNETSSSELLTVKGSLDFNELGCVVKVENLLAMNIGGARNRIVYPYFAEDPPLTEDAATLGLWAMSTCLLSYAPDELRVLDVLRATSFAYEDVAFSGDEKAEFERRYEDLLKLWQELRREYEPA